MQSQPGTDDGMAVIAASFGIGAGLATPSTGGAEDLALAAAGLPRRVPKRPVYPFNLPPGILTGTAVGSFLDQSDQFGPSTGWFWDVTSITLSGFTAGAITVTRNAPAVDSAGNPIAVEVVVPFASAGTVSFPQKGNPLLDGNDRLVFTVTSALTGVCRITGTVIMVPAERIDDYLS